MPKLTKDVFANNILYEVAQQSRRFAATSAAHKHVESRRDSGYIDDDEMDQENGGGGSHMSRRMEEGTSRPSAVPYPKVRPKADPRPLVEHLEKLFPSLELPDVVASQALTHISAKEAWAGHNARLSFVGTSSCCVAALALNSMYMSLCPEYRSASA